MRTSIILAAALSAAGCKDKTQEQPAPEVTADLAPEATAPSPGPAGEPAATEEETGEAAEAVAEERPLYYERALTDADLEGRSLRELSLMRNTIFARAGNRFRNPWLAEYFEAQPWYRPLDTIDQKKLSAVDRENAAAIGKRETEMSRDELMRRREEVLARISADEERADDEVELRLLARRLGDWVSPERTASGRAPLEPLSPLENPSLLDRLLTVEELENLSLRDLRILRNTVYARHGREFRSAVLSFWFESYSWYEIDSDYSDARLTAIDRKNVRLIRSVEDSLGGPIGEGEHSRDLEWLFAS